MSSFRLIGHAGITSNRTQSQFSQRAEKLPTYLAIYLTAVLLYASFGRGFAYLGYTPVFIGEVLLGIGMFAAWKTGQLPLLAHTRLGSLLCIFTAWEVSRTIPYVSVYRLDSLRDGMLWGYSSFAWITAALVLSMHTGAFTVVSLYRRLIGAVVSLGLGSYLATTYVTELLPVWPGSDAVTIICVKAGDLCVTLAGAMAFFIVGLEGRTRWWLAVLMAAVIVCGSGNRGGLLAFLSASTVAVLLLPRPQKLIPVVALTFLCLSVLLLLDVRLTLPKSDRYISADQVVDNLTSVFGNNQGTEANLSGTKEWRLKWWNTIIDYTFRGEYFWLGKGYGVNLTVSDGMARTENDFKGLRSPHNSHLNFLARSGVPGLSMWLALQLTWAVSMWNGFWLARRDHKTAWAKLFTWLLAYWVAFIVNAAFDVSLEGPTAAVPFWTIFGLGWAALIRFRHEQELTRHASSQLSLGDLIWHAQA